MEKSYSYLLKSLSILSAMFLATTAAFAQVQLLVEVEQIPGNTPVVNHPVWIKVDTNPPYILSGSTDAVGRLWDSVPSVISPTAIHFATYDCNGNLITGQDTLYSSTSWTGDTLSIGCASPTPQINPSFLSFPDTLVSSPLAHIFKGSHNSTALPAGMVYTYHWDFGDGTTATGKDTNHNYNIAGNYNVCLTVTATDTTSFITLQKTYCSSVTHGGTTCQADFGIANTAPSPVFTFTDSSQASSTLPYRISYHWDFGDGSGDTLQNVTHTYSSPGTYQVCHWIEVIDSATQNIICSDTLCRNVVFTNPNPLSCNADFVFTPDSTQPMAVDFLGTSSHSGGTQYSTRVNWDFGDGGSSTNNSVAYVYTTPGTYNVCLTYEVLDSLQQVVCVDSICKQVVVTLSKFCQASYIVDTANSFFGNVYIWNNSTPAYFSSKHTNRYFWNFGDGDTSTQAFPAHTYSSPGIYPVCLTITSIDSLSNTCTDTFCDTLGVDSLGNLIYKNGTIFTLTVLNPETIGIEEKELEEFKMYPNPATDKVILEWESSGESQVTWCITDIKGAILMAGDEEVNGVGKLSIDVGRLGTGVYILSASRKGNPNTHYKLKIN